MAQIFLSYRREDSVHFTYRLQDGLQRAFQHDTIFVDGHMGAGKEYPEEIRRQLAASDVLIAVIGRKWGARFGGAHKDWVLEEIEHALADHRPIIPVLIDGAGIPATSELPGSIASILRYQFHQFSNPSLFQEDLARLMPAIKGVMRKDYRWSVVELGSLGREFSATEAYDINATGDICGSSFTVNGFRRAFLWKFQERQMFELGTIGCNESEARALNDHLGVAGWSEDHVNRRKAFFLDAEKYLSTERSNDGMCDLGVPGGHATNATAINNRNEVVGVFGDVYGETRRRGFFWHAESGLATIEPLTGCEHSVAHALNDSGIIAGSSYDTDQRAWYACTFRREQEGGPFVAFDPRLRNQFNTCCSDFFGINESGLAVGRSRRPPDSQRIDQGVVVKTPGHVLNVIWPGDEGGRFLGVNDAGTAVGYSGRTDRVGGRRAVVCADGCFSVLNYQTVDGLGDRDSLSEAVAINNDGMILCRGERAGVKRSFLLLPKGG